MPDYIAVITTVETREDADRIAEALVTRRLAACAQIEGPIQSVYWWKGEVEKAQEYRVTAKTRCTLYEDMESAIRELHPYETPEIVALPIVAGWDDYLNWIGAETESATQ